jgi:hypothetical protein
MKNNIKIAPFAISILLMTGFLSLSCSHAPKSDSAGAATGSESDKAKAANEMPPLPANSNCKFNEDSIHTDPAKLVKDFVDHERKGQLKLPSAWYDGASVCPAAEGAPDNYGVVTLYRIREVSMTAESAEYEVSYDVAGGLKYDHEKSRWKWDFKRKPVEKRTITVYKMPNGWRLDSLLMKDGSYLTPGAVRALGQPDLERYLEKYAPTKPK